MEKLRKSFVAYALVALGVLSFVCCSSGDDDNGVVGGSDGIVTTNAVVDVTAVEATLTGTVSQNFLTNTSIYCFGVSYGVDEDAGDNVCTTSSITGTTFTITLSSLTPETTYYYKAFVEDSEGNRIYGSTRKFTTLKFSGSSSVKAIDLGLPSGTKWASCNIGASKPEGYGAYFAWGETSPKNSYTSKNYVLKLRDIIGDDGKLKAEYDAASVNWGESWRIPTETQMNELLDNDNCTWVWKTLNGVKGYKVMSNKNGNSIFLPAAGSCYNNIDGGERYSRGSLYWCSTAYYHYNELYIDLLELRYPRLNRFRAWGYNGLPIRPVTK